MSPGAVENRAPRAGANYLTGGDFLANEYWRNRRHHWVRAIQFTAAPLDFIWKRTGLKSLAKLLCMVAALALSRLAFGSDTLNLEALTRAVDQAFEYGGKIEAADITKSSRHQNPGTIWSANFVPKDSSLPVTTVILARGKSFLTEQMRRDLSSAAARDIKLPTGKLLRLAAPIKLHDGSDGFSYFGGFGPGGASSIAAITTRDGKYDIAIAIGFSSSNSPDKSEAESTPAKNYEKAMLTVLEWVLKNSDSQIN